MTKFVVYSSLTILALIALQVQSAVLPVSSKEVAMVETSTPSEGSGTAIDTLGSSRVKRQGGCGCCGCGCCGCGGGGGGGYAVVAVVVVAHAAERVAVPDAALAAVRAVVDVEVDADADADVADVEVEDVSVVPFRIFASTRPIVLRESEEDQLTRENASVN
uniref:Uncharacterized protein n=1 Tax=Caenorhabditis japonica TaxID=281687 RepID=A0A8R1HL02_CAEJA